MKNKHGKGPTCGQPGRGSQEQGQEEEENSSGVVLSLAVFLCWSGVLILNLICTLYFILQFSSKSAFCTAKLLEIFCSEPREKHSNYSHVKLGVGVHYLGKMCECPGL